MKTQIQTMTRRTTAPYTLTLAALALGASLTAFGQLPVISSFSQNGELVCTNLPPGTGASVEWAPTVTGPWTNNWEGLEIVPVGSNGMIRVSVPMFYRVCGIGVPTNMALIPAGSFTMGDSFSEGDSGEVPTHTVYVSAFYMDRHEVTKALWGEVHLWAITHGYSFEYGAQGKANNHPAQSVTWYDAVKWCNARSEKEGRVPAYYTDAGLSVRYRTGQVAPYVRWNSGYRLPTEAEWEKAARGGASGRRFPWSDTDTIQHSRANYYSDSSDAYDTSPTRGYHPTFATGGYPYTSPVDYFSPNGYGLHDMAGNVWEWCWDWQGAYSSGAQSDPRGAASGSERVERGNSWIGGYAWYCRAAARTGHSPASRSSDRGFRCALPPIQ